MPLRGQSRVLDIIWSLNRPSRVSRVFEDRPELQGKEASEVEWDSQGHKGTKDLKDNLWVSDTDTYLLRLDQYDFMTFCFWLLTKFFLRVILGNQDFQEFWELLDQGYVHYQKTAHLPQTHDPNTRS